MAHLAYSGDDEPLAALAFAVLERFWWGGGAGRKSPWAIRREPCLVVHMVSRVTTFDDFIDNLC